MTLDCRYKIVRQSAGVGDGSWVYVPCFCARPIRQEPFATEREARQALEAFHEDRMEKAA